VPALAKVRGSFLPPFAHARAGDLLVVGDDLPSALELARHAFRLVDEQHHDVEDGLLEVDHLRGAGELPPQRDHLVEEQLEALYLHLRAREAVEQRAVLLLRLKQLAQQDADHLPVPDHAAACLDGARLRCVKELGNHNGRRLARKGKTGSEAGTFGVLSFMAINAQPLEKVKLATLPDSYSSAQS